MFKKNWFLAFLVLVAACTSSRMLQGDKPTFYIIGDSTVRNGDGTGKGSLWGWGSFLSAYFDTTKITVENDALGGRSSRTFLTEGRWANVLSKLKKGDYVVMQFGHNDGGPLDDTARARGTFKGIGEEAKEIYNPITKKQEVVHSYGWYMRQYVRDAKKKGAVPIVASLVPRNQWKDGRVVRSADSYSGWAQAIAKEEGVTFIDLNDLVATRYEALGENTVKTFFPGDHTHTNREGAELNAKIVAQQLKEKNPDGLRRFLN